MKADKQPETKIIIVVPPTVQPQPPKKPKVNKSLLKAIALITITIVSWLNPKVTIAIALVKLLFIWLEGLNQNKA